MTHFEPFLTSWRGGTVRVRHDDPERLGNLYSPAGSVVRNAIHLATDLRGLELSLNATVGDRYSVAVAQRGEGVVVELRRR